MYQSQPRQTLQCTSYILTMLSIPNDIWQAFYNEFSEDCPETPLTVAKSAFAMTCDTMDVTHHACRHPTLPPVEENLARASFVCCQWLQCKACFASPITHGTPVYSHGPTVSASSILFWSQLWFHCRDASSYSGPQMSFVPPLVTYHLRLFVGSRSTVIAVISLGGSFPRSATYRSRKITFSLKFHVFNRRGQQAPHEKQWENYYCCCIVAPNLSESSNRFSSATLHLGSQQQNDGVCSELWVLRLKRVSM